MVAGVYHFSRNRAPAGADGEGKELPDMVPIESLAASPPPVAPAPPASAPPPSSSFAALLAGLGREVHRGESLLRSAMGAGSAGALDPADLLALQAGVYRYGQAVDLVSRLVDRATTAVKTVVQGT